MAENEVQQTLVALVGCGSVSGRVPIAIHIRDTHSNLLCEDPKTSDIVEDAGVVRRKFAVARWSSGELDEVSGSEMGEMGRERVRGKRRKLSKQPFAVFFSLVNQRGSIMEYGPSIGILHGRIGSVLHYDVHSPVPTPEANAPTQKRHFVGVVEVTA